MLEENAIKFNYWLAPFAFLYGIGVRIRNWLFDKSILPSEEYPIPVICVGNLTVGGTGKTPHTELIIEILKKEHRIAVLSRGYKRKTKGFVLADLNSTSEIIGDEPYQIKQKYPDILVAVDEDRRRGIQKLLSLEDHLRPGIILMDDAFQHRYVTPSLSIVLTDFNRLFYNDKLLPLGRLRENKEGIRRADVVIVTKCPEEMKPIEYRIIEENIALWAHQRLYFSKIIYGDLKPVFPDKASLLSKKSISKNDDLFILTGIAQPQPFLNEIKHLSGNIFPFIYPDHHDFSRHDIQKIESCIQQQSTTGDPWIITTEKDASRLKNNPFIPENWKTRLYYLPITIGFCLNNNLSFECMLNKHLQDFEKNKILLLNK